MHPPSRVRGPHCEAIIIFSSKNCPEIARLLSERENNDQFNLIPASESTPAKDCIIQPTSQEARFFFFLLKGEGVFLLFYLACKNVARCLNFMATALSVYAMVISSIFSACKTRH